MFILIDMSHLISMKEQDVSSVVLFVVENRIDVYHMVRNLFEGGFPVYDEMGEACSTHGE